MIQAEYRRAEETTIEPLPQLAGQDGWGKQGGLDLLGFYFFVTFIDILWNSRFRNGIWERPLQILNRKVIFLIRYGYKKLAKRPTSNHPHFKSYPQNQLLTKQNMRQCTEMKCSKGLPVTPYERMSKTCLKRCVNVNIIRTIVFSMVIRLISTLHHYGYSIYLLLVFFADQSVSWTWSPAMGGLHWNIWMRKVFVCRDYWVKFPSINVTVYTALVSS